MERQRLPQVNLYLIRYKMSALAPAVSYLHKEGSQLCNTAGSLWRHKEHVQSLLQEWEGDPGQVQCCVSTKIFREPLYAGESILVTRSVCSGMLLSEVTLPGLTAHLIPCIPAETTSETLSLRQFNIFIHF